MPLTEFDQLPPLARAKRYRALAQDARDEAKKVYGPLRESYRISAEKWEAMAAELEGDVTWDDPPKK